MDWADDYINQVIQGDCLEVMKAMPDGCVDAIITDPPYGLGFMGKDWDHGVPGAHFWAAALRVAKPGAHLLAFGGTRTWHRLACAVEDAGWQIRDTIGYLYGGPLLWVTGQGFPKGHDVAWGMHKIACTSCGVMVECRHEETQSDEAANEEKAGGTARGESPPEHGLRFVRATYLSTPVYACSECGQVLQPFLPEQDLQAHRAAWSQSKTCWPEQPGVEGRSDVQAESRELYGCQVCQMSHGVFADGAEGRVRHGAPLDNGAVPWQVPEPDGSRPSYRPQSPEQLSRQPDAFRIERAAQARRGWNCALKPAYEPIIVARKPPEGTVAANVQEHGCGGLNIDGCRVGTESPAPKNGLKKIIRGGKFHAGAVAEKEMSHYNPTKGRWPANVIHDGSEEVLAGFPQTASGKPCGMRKAKHHWDSQEAGTELTGHGDSGSAARFFYCAKADKSDKHDVNNHPTVKPTALMRYLCRLVCPPAGVILDPFAGSGSSRRRSSRGSGSLASRSTRATARSPARGSRPSWRGRHYGRGQRNE